MGLLIGIGNTMPKFPYDYYYGVEFDINVASPACTRIGRPEFHVSLPIQSRMRRCILNNAGTVVYYLHAQDSTKRDNATAADLTGASGQVMVELPEYYIRFEMEGTKRRCLMSLEELPGFYKIPKMYVSAYEATIDRTIPSTLKLASVVNTTADFRGCNNQSDRDETYRSALGRPATSFSINIRKYARNRGSINWSCMTYDAHKSLFWLFAVEYATFNCQTAYNAALTPEGHRQGGLGDGVTTLNSTKWAAFNDSYPFIPCGHTNSLGNATGLVPFKMPAEYDATILTVQVPSYRGIENPFGHIAKLVDGCFVNVDIDGKVDFYVCSRPDLFDDEQAYKMLFTRIVTGGFLKDIHFNSKGDIFPTETSGSSSTYYCDYFEKTIPSNAKTKYAVRYGFAAHMGTFAGLAGISTSLLYSAADAKTGTRLCYLKNPDYYYNGSMKMIGTIGLF